MKERYTLKVAVFLILTKEINGSTEVLLQRRVNTGYMDGKYDTSCSGHLEKGESILTATVREAKEELSIDVDENDLKLVAIIHPYKEEYLNIFFKANTYTGTPKIIEENKCDDLQWFDVNNLPENTIKRCRKVIEDMKNEPFCDDGDFSHKNSNI